jgi:heterodisulfide reductase subunit B2
MQTTIDSGLARQIQRQCGENVFLCYQCQKCSSGCPVAEYFDLAPNQLIRAVQLGRKAMVLQSRTLWLCAMCETCAVRCPHDINITKIMDVLKIMAREEGIASPLPAAVVFNQAALRGIRTFGKMYEAGLMGEVTLRQMARRGFDYTQFLKQDLPLALRMVKKGKLRLLPSFGKVTVPKQPGRKKEAIAYYPGCSLHGTSREYDLSARAVLSTLGVAIEEPKNWRCCGSTPAHSTDHYLSVSLPLGNALAAEKEGFDHITTPCPSCFIRLRTAQRESREPGIEERLRAEWGEIPTPDLKIEHLLETITERVGYHAVQEKVLYPLEGLKVVCYYGCIITRPPKITGSREYEYPTSMDRLMTAAGATPLDWSYKTRCCGATLGITRAAISRRLTEKILQNARGVGADAVVVACPLCHINLDAHQGQIGEESGETFNIPIVYFTQVLGLAFGIHPSRLGVSKHFVDPVPLIDRITKAKPHQTPESQ